MKGIFVAYNQAYFMEVANILERHNSRGFTRWNEINGRGSETGEPHYGDHTWPVMNDAILSFVADEESDGIMEALHKLDSITPELGLRAFCWQIEKSI
ncbi:MAG: hypothetical protein MJZ56_05035 [Bacteroidales bacterium]|nr:hypothetical protein [Bacteroidales bacterium]